MENLLFLGVLILKHIRVYKWGPFDRDFAIKGVCVQFQGSNAVIYISSSLLKRCLFSKRDLLSKDRIGFSFQ